MPIEAIIDRYCAAWSDPDAARRKALLDDVWAHGATYTDPTVHLVGAAALLDHVAMVQVKRPGGCVERVGEVDFHHDVACFHWHAVLPDGTSVREGLDLAIFDEAGRLSRVIGFFAPLPARDGSHASGGAVWRIRAALLGSAPSLFMLAAG